MMTTDQKTGTDKVVIPDVLPVLPLRNTVVFPLAVAPLLVGQERSIKLVDEAMRTNRLVALVTQRKPEVQPAGPDDLYRVGTVGTIHQLLRGSDGTLRLIIQGIERIRIVDFARTEPYLVATVQQAPELEAEEGMEVEALVRTLRDLFKRVVGMIADLPEDLAAAAETLSEPRQIVYLVASSLPFPIEARQEVLEIDPIPAKLRRLIELVQHELAVRELGARITSQTREQIDKAQRDYFLREQMKAIQKELGEEGPEQAEAGELRRRLGEVPLSEEARKEAERELVRLEQIPPASPEHGIIRTYLDWLLSLPWEKRTGAPIDVPRARAVLDEDHYDLEKIKDRILEHLAVKKLRDERQPKPAPTAAGEKAQAPEEETRREPILCFVGPPGVGKTSLGQSIARAMGRKFIRISLGGVHDEAEIRGHRRTYIGALPGRIVQALRRADASDPVFMLDEVDKLGVGFHGDPSAALLEVLDPAQNNKFVDTYLGVPFDLSQVMFICTANTTETIPPALLDRMELLPLSGYTEMEKVQIARRYLLQKLIRAHGLLEGETAIDDEALRRIIRDYTRESGVRGLERTLAAVLRKAARRIGEGTKPPIEIKSDQLRDYLGPSRFFDELAERIDRPGVATGLAWTPTGGDILFIEATMMPSREERLILTGMLGDVMRESVQAALSYLRSNAGRLGIDPRAFEGKTVHVHVPAGAIPKDGPSAGVTMASAIASLATGRFVRNDLAMTGEITLRGKVLPVGGIKEKVLAAYRAGVKTIILPRRNESALEDVPEEVRKKLRFVLVNSIEDVLDAALAPVAESHPTPVG
jgi:ATP-dependent Lon protease